MLDQIGGGLLFLLAAGSILRTELTDYIARKEARADDMDKAERRLQRRVLDAH